MSEHSHVSTKLVSIEARPSDVLILIRVEENRPLVLAPARPYDLELATSWIASRPDLLELLEKAYEVRYGPDWREILGAER